MVILDINGAVFEEEHTQQYGRKRRKQHLELERDYGKRVLQTTVDEQYQVQQPG